MRWLERHVDETKDMLRAFNFAIAKLEAFLLASSIAVGLSREELDQPPGDLVWGHGSLCGPSGAGSFRQDHVRALDGFSDAKKGRLRCLRVPLRRQEDVTGKNRGVDGASQRIIHVGKRADSLLVLEDRDASERLGLGAQAKACEQNARTGAPDRFAGRPLDKCVGKMRAPLPLR